MDLDIHQLRVFIEVVQSGSFSKAGEKLNLSQSAVSQSIGKLEKQLNLILIDRIARPFQLTRAGRLLVDKVQLTESDPSQNLLSSAKSHKISNTGPGKNFETS